ncbi:MAG: hypothetical protein LBT45_00645 [Rickettsiales bacterium]|jgi:hypothetical protein|nr:hypothetical protein [Rickettsiales bacterium]
MDTIKIIMDAAEVLLELQVLGEMPKFCTYEEAFRAINTLNPAAKIGTMRGKCCLNSPKRGVFAVKRRIADLIDSEYLNLDLSPKYGFKEVQIKQVLDKLSASGLDGTFLSISDLHAAVAKHVKVSEDVFRSMLYEQDKPHFSQIVMDGVKKLMTDGYFDMSHYEKISNKARSLEIRAARRFVSGEITIGAQGYFPRHYEFVKKFAKETNTTPKTARSKCHSPFVEPVMRKIVNER